MASVYTLPDVLRVRLEVLNGVAVNMANGPVTAATEYLRWTNLAQSVANLVLIGVAALIVAVAVVPVEAAPYRFGPG